MGRLLHTLEEFRDMCFTSLQALHFATLKLTQTFIIKLQQGAKIFVHSIVYTNSPSPEYLLTSQHL